MSDRYMVIHPDTLAAMRRAGHVAKLEARIEKLEAALQEFIDPCIEHCFGTCQSECDPMKDCPCFKARKALEGKDD